MDVRDLKFDTGSFDVAIDKGTMDAMMTKKGDVWVRSVFLLSLCVLTSHHQDPPEEVVENCNKEVDEVLR